MEISLRHKQWIHANMENTGGYVLALIVVYGDNKLAIP